MSDPNYPSYPPKRSAAKLNNGQQDYGPTGQLWEVHDGFWIKLQDPPQNEHDDPWPNLK